MVELNIITGSIYKKNIKEELYLELFPGVFRPPPLFEWTEDINTQMSSVPPPFLSGRKASTHRCLVVTPPSSMHNTLSNTRRTTFSAMHNSNLLLPLIPKLAWWQLAIPFLIIVYYYYLKN